MNTVVLGKNLVLKRDSDELWFDGHRGSKERGIQLNQYHVRLDALDDIVESLNSVLVSIVMHRRHRLW